MADHLEPRAAWAGEKSFPGMDKLPLPATPGDKDSKEMLVAHRVDDSVRAVGHAEERMSAALKAGDSGLRKYHSTHIANHLAVALSNMHYLVDNFQRHYPAEAAELEALRQCVGLARSLDKATRVATTAHLTETVLHELTHAKRHADQMLKPDPKAVWDFNADHARKHLKGAQEHVDKLHEHLSDNYPAIGSWLGILKRLQDGHLATSEPAWKELKLTGSSALDKILRLASPAAWPSGKPYAKSFLSPPRDGDGPVVVSAPGAGVLRQEPSQTVSAGPPLPPGAPLPSPEELRAFGAKIAKIPDGEQNHHLAGAVMHLESAAEKMPNNPVTALASLRSAQMAIQDEWRETILRHRPRIAFVFSESSPPEEQAMKQAESARAQAAIGQIQGAASTVAEFIDRVRRAYFHRMGMENQTAGGGMAGQPNARLAAEDLDQVIGLAQVNVRQYQRFEKGKEQNVRQHSETRADRAAQNGWIPTDKWRQGQLDWEKAGESAFKRGGDAARAKEAAEPDHDSVADHLKSAHGVNLAPRHPGDKEASPEELMQRHQYLHHSGIANNHNHVFRLNPTAHKDPVRMFQEATMELPEPKGKFDPWGFPLGQK